MKFILSFLALALVSTTVLAQQSNTNSELLVASNSKTNTDAVDWANFENEIDGTEDWTFQQNSAGDILYIDFERTGQKMEHLTLKNSEGTVVKSDYDLFDLPINTIYELNLENLPRGTYFVELYTFEEQVIKETITIK